MRSVGDVGVWRAEKNSAAPPPIPSTSRTSLDPPLGLGKTARPGSPLGTAAAAGTTLPVAVWAGEWVSPPVLADVGPVVGSEGLIAVGARASTFGMIDASDAPLTGMASECWRRSAPVGDDPLTANGVRGTGTEELPLAGLFCCTCSVAPPPASSCWCWWEGERSGEGTFAIVSASSDR